VAAVMDVTVAISSECDQIFFVLESIGSNTPPSTEQVFLLSLAIHRLRGEGHTHSNLLVEGGDAFEKLVRPNAPK